MKWLLFLVVFPIHAATYYVATTGNNSNIGSQGSPWLTISNAARNMVAGDTTRIQVGTYDERITPSASGSSGSPITYVCDGRVICRGFDISGKSYTKFIGIEITHTGATNTYAAFLLDTLASNNEIVDCYIHDVNSWGIRIGGGSSTGSSNIVRGNIITNVGYITGTNYDGNACIYCLGTNNLIEYNQLGRCSDFISARSAYHNIVRNNLMSDVQTNYFLESSPHVDMWESQPPNTALSNAVIQNLVERNFVLSNMTPNSHGILLQDTSLSTNDAGINIRDFICRQNVFQYLGSGIFAAQGFPGFKCYNNTCSHVNAQIVGGGANSGIITVDRGSTNCTLLNGIFYNNGAVNSYTYNLDATTSGNVIIDGDCTFGGGYQNPPETHGMTNNPNFVDEPNNNFRLSAGSPLIAAGQPMTLTSGTGTSTNAVVVVDSRMFYDGWNISLGDSILVSGNSIATVTNADYANNLVYFDSNLTWTNNAPVFLNGTQDIGALPYSSIALTAATISHSGTTYTVIPSGDARGVWFYVDGIPTTWDSSSPYSATIASGTVTARAYALYAQSTPFVNATPAPTSILNGTGVLRNAVLR